MALWTLIQGSPRANGKSARICRMITAYLKENAPDIELQLFDVARCDISGCNGCDYCKTSEECIIRDDMQALINSLDKSDRVVLVTPIYFASLPSQTKAVIDRLQPYFWDYTKNGPSTKKRPLSLYVVGDGGDPHGYEPLLVSVKSAFALAGFAIDYCIEIIGKRRLSSNDIDLDFLERATKSECSNLTECVLVDDKTKLEGMAQ